MIYEYDERGEITRAVFCPDNEISIQTIGDRFVIAPVYFDLDRYYIRDGAFVAKGEQPGPSHTWDWNSRSWVIDFDVERLRLQSLIESTLANLLYQPIACHGAAFDADRTARERITNTILRLQSGAGLPAGWIGWRDADNAMHWAEADAGDVLLHLQALSRAIEDREQALLIAAWAHKAAVGALAEAEDAEGLVGYDVYTGWG